MAQCVKCLLCKHKNLNSGPKHSGENQAWQCISVIPELRKQRQGSGVQGQPQKWRELQTSLGYIRLSQNTSKGLEDSLLF